MGELNEWELLEKIEAAVPAAGDDCAVIPWGDIHLLLTTDLLHQSSDFPPGTTPYTMGWRVVAASLSDIAAMGGRPVAVVLAASAPSWEDLFPGLLAGAQAACRGAGTELVGGDLDFSQELTLVATALGEAVQPVRRAGAKPGDLLCLTGALGRTALALHLFSRGALEEANRLFRFSPRLQEGQRLAGLATAMIDVSDGLAHSAHLLARASRVGMEIDVEALPLLPGLAEAFPGEAREQALYCGEDYELLFTIPPDRYRPELGRVIGEVVPSGVWLREDGRRRPLPDRGWSHGP